MGDTMTPREKLDKAFAQAFKEYMRDTASARRLLTLRRNKADTLFKDATKPASDEYDRKRKAVWDEFGLESAKKG